MAASETDGQLGILRHSITGLVRRKGPDLSARQLAIFLTCYLESESQTVRGLAAKLSISKPAVTRALDRLMEFDLVRRRRIHRTGGKGTNGLTRPPVLFNRAPATRSLARRGAPSWKPAA